MIEVQPDGVKFSTKDNLLPLEKGLVNSQRPKPTVLAVLDINPADTDPVLMEVLRQQSKAAANSLNKVKKKV